MLTSRLMPRNGATAEKRKRTRRTSHPKNRNVPTQLRLAAPKARRVTPYDEAHFATYLRLLNANAHASKEGVMLAIIRDIAPALNGDDALRALRSHLARALWISDEGYRDLLKGGGIAQRRNSR